MRNAIIIHGWATEDEYYNPNYPTNSNSHWLPWLSKQLMIKDIHTVAIEMPQSYFPNYEKWKKELERFEINENIILIGHSCGGGFLIRWLSENSNKKVDKVILVAPWMGIDPEQPFDAKFFDFDIDSNIVARTAGMTIINSTNDVKSIHKSIDIIRDNIDKIKYIELENKGHFTLKGLGGVEFPELLEEILS